MRAHLKSARSHCQLGRYHAPLGQGVKDSQVAGGVLLEDPGLTLEVVGAPAVGVGVETVHFPTAQRGPAFSARLGGVAVRNKARASLQWFGVSV